MRSSANKKFFKQSNFPHSKIFNEDVIDFLALASEGDPGYPKKGEVSHIHASTPCQGFSDANRTPGGGKLGEHNRNLIRTWVESIRIYRPCTASFENVPGLLKTQHRRYLREMVAQLLELNYNVRKCVLDAADFGDPQHRKRVFLLVSRKGIMPPKEPVPSHGHGLMPHRTVRDAIGDLSGISPKAGSGQIVVGGIIVSGHCRCDNSAVRGLFVVFFVCFLTSSLIPSLCLQQGRNRYQV
jgi:site-specific DNA-cytosine methylase